MKRICRLIMDLVLLTLCQTAGAQEFFNLTAQQVRIDSLLPVFTWQKSLGTNYADSVYKVSIEYPEFIDMHESDIRRYLKISGQPLPEMPVVSQTVGDKSWGTVDFRPTWPAVFPAIAFILYIMARRAINADEKLVRSMDRIR